MNPNVGEPALVKDIPYLRRNEICRALNLPSILGQGDYKILAGLMEMHHSDVMALSRDDNPADALLSWWGVRIYTATVANLRELLLHPSMRREDLVRILDSTANPQAVDVVDLR